MPTELHPIFAQALAPYAPPQSEVHRIAADLTYNEDKAQKLNAANELAAMKAQIQDNPEYWGIA